MSCVTLRPRCSGTEFVIRQGDTLPAFTADARDCDGAIDFTGWTLTFSMSGPVDVTGAAVGTAAGAVSYAWAAGDTAVPGTYAVKLVGVSPAPAAKPQTFPTRGFVTVVIEPS